jgi:hypothetical protein
MAETRTGFAFNNPNTTDNYLAPGFGFLVSADELRYDELFGNPLVAEADSNTFTDDQLNDYVRISIAYTERELNIHILPRLIRYDDPIGEDGNPVTRDDIDDTAYLSSLRTQKQKTSLYLRESGYPYRVIAARQECRVKLRRRPVRDVLTANFVDPYFGETIIDLMPYRIVKKGLSGVCYFRPRQASGRTHSFQYLFQRYLIMPTYRTLQDIFKIDYTTGYANCQDVPDDLRMIIKKIAAVTLMATYGDGKFAAISNRSVSLNSVSESIGTTLSATSAAFGARILQYQKEIKEWFKQNRSKYSNTLFGAL